MTIDFLPMIGPFMNGRDAQSMRFFVTAEYEWLYSGVAMMTPSASATAARNAATMSGTVSASKSWLYNGNSEISKCAIVVFAGASDGNA
jgi:hypothetical protein